MTDSKKKLSPFAKGMLIYITVFLILAAACLCVLYGFVRAYENSRPASCMDAYLENMEENGLSEACREAVDALGISAQSQKDRQSEAEKLISEASYVKLGSLSGTGRGVYSIVCCGQEIGRVQLESTGKASYGFDAWELAGEEYDFSSVAVSSTIAVPPEYSVCINGSLLDESFVTDSKAEYETLSQCYGTYDPLPYLRVYNSGLCLGGMELYVRDASGKELSEEMLCEAYYLDNCVGERRDQVTAFAEDLIDRYVVFGANVSGDSNRNYEYLKQLVVAGSQLHTRMKQAFEGFGYSNTRSCKILSSTINACSELGDGRYLVDMSYTTETVALAGPVEAENNTRIVIVEENGRLLAEAIYNY